MIHIWYTKYFETGKLMGLFVQCEVTIDAKFAAEFAVGRRGYDVLTGAHFIITASAIL